jgi:RNA-binding protein 5/10
MFYENESDFFYDPKSKLYYGNKSQIYYRYDPFATPFFVEVQKIDESKMTVASENEIIHAPGKPSSTESKPPTISINIKSKSLKVKKKQRTEDIKPDRATPAVSIPFRAKKKHETDMEKWSNRQTEKQHDVERPVLGSVPAISSKVTRTANGEPICVLCQRKFPNLEKLKVHERASKLHQENLKKQGLSKRDNEEKQKNYADRAQQRRNMYGVESMPVCTVLPAIESTPIPTQLSATDTLGTSNIGNKMLQKLGWKEGNSIGRSVGQGSHHGSQQVQLAKEWERIEALADANMAKRPHR